MKAGGGEWRGLQVGERDERMEVLGGGGGRTENAGYVGRGRDVGARVGSVYGLGGCEGVAGSGEGGVE